MTSTLLWKGHVYAAHDPFATAMLMVDGQIAWLGDDAGARVHADDVDITVDLQGAWVAPAFVDAHVHLTATGLTLLGVDLSTAGSVGEFLSLLRAAAGQGSGVILGHGWDDSTWPEGRPPTTAEVDDAVGERPAYLSRVDVHSAVASTALRARAAAARERHGWSEQGALTRDAHHVIREAAFAAMTVEQRERAQRAALRTAASRGIASVHENAGPSISGPEDLRGALALGGDPAHPEVVGYWGELHGQGAAVDLGARGAAGDLFVDGSLGSHTACLRLPYLDRPDGVGVAYISPEEVAAHVIASTHAGQQAGFHVIGDGATDVVVSGLLRARDEVGDVQMRAARHRLEHLEMPDAEHVRILAELGVVASVQPAFDAAWGGSDRMYAARLGSARAAGLNPWSTMLAAGVVLALGSDAPVTPLDPWGAVRAGVSHTRDEHRISARAAFAAHTRGGRRAARDEGHQPGVLQVGAPATYAVWEPWPLVVHAPDGRLAAWSTDPRSGTAPLPDVSDGTPACWLTVRDGHVLHDAGALT
jgi:predicted amidohydrolase YtcJ